VSSSGADPGRPDDSRVRLEWPGVATGRPGARPPLRHAEPEQPDPLDPERPAAAPVHRDLVDADDPLADRLLQRLLTIRDDLGAEMAALRLEVAALRQSVDELRGRFPTGHLGPVLDELAQLRAEVGQLVAVGPVAPKLGSLAPLVAEIAALRDELSLDPVLAELAELRSELAHVRRRVALRAANADAPGFPPS